MEIPGKAFNFILVLKYWKTLEFHSHSFESLGNTVEDGRCHLLISPTPLSLPTADMVMFWTENAKYLENKIYFRKKLHKFHT